MFRFKSVYTSPSLSVVKHCVETKPRIMSCDLDEESCNEKLYKNEACCCMRPSDSYCPSGENCDGGKWQDAVRAAGGEREARRNLENQPHALVPSRDLSSRACPEVGQPPGGKTLGSLFFRTDLYRSPPLTIPNLHSWSGGRYW